MDLFLERLEKKLALIPIAGGILAEIPVLISLVKAYLQKRYAKVPIGTIIAIVGALLYFLSPIDLVPDLLPAIGLIDDAAVIALALKTRPRRCDGIQIVERRESGARKGVPDGQSARFLSAQNCQLLRRAAFFACIETETGFSGLAFWNI